MKCECGREARYLLRRGEGMLNSCNKYKVCPTYRELEESEAAWRKRAIEAENDLEILRRVLAPSRVSEQV